MIHGDSSSSTVPYLRSGGAPPRTPALGRRAPRVGAPCRGRPALRRRPLGELVLDLLVELLSCDCSCESAILPACHLSSKCRAGRRIRRPRRAAAGRMPTWGCSRRQERRGTAAAALRSGDVRRRRAWWARCRPRWPSAPGSWCRMARYLTSSHAWSGCLAPLGMPTMVPPTRCGAVQVGMVVGGRERRGAVVQLGMLALDERRSPLAVERHRHLAVLERVAAG